MKVLRERRFQNTAVMEAREVQLIEVWMGSAYGSLEQHTPLTGMKTGRAKPLTRNFGGAR